MATRVRTRLDSPSQWLEEQELEDVAGLEEGLESESRRKRLTAWTVIWISRFTLLTDFHFGTELSRQAS